MTDYNIDQLRESVVKILDVEKGMIAGSGFVIRSDGYLITCYHVIYRLSSLNVEYQGQRYEAEWCEELSNPEVDIAILKIDVKDAKAVPIIHPHKLETSVIVYGFPYSKERQFPEGFNVSAEHIQRSAPINTLATYPRDASVLLEKLSNKQTWNVLPQEQSTFQAYRIDEEVNRGTSGGPVFAEDLDGTIGVIQCSGRNESYAIRWDNITEALDKLGIEPQKNAVCRFLEEVENNFKYIRLFHTPQKIVLKDQYIPIEVTLERRYRHEVETTWGYAEDEADLSRAYAMKGVREDEPRRTEVPWKEAKEKHRQIIVLADPGMGKTALLRMEAVTTAQEEKEKLMNNEKSVEDVVFPLFLRLSDLVKRPEENMFDTILKHVQDHYPETSPGIAHLLNQKLKEGKCLLLLDALDEIPKESRFDLSTNLNIFARNYPCPITATSRIIGYGGTFLHDAKEVEIVPFRREQIEQYIKTWFMNAAHCLDDETVSTKELIRELQQKPQIHGLVQNPLLLSLICSLYQKKDLTLPARRVQLYEHAVNCMLGEWRAEHSRQQPEKGWVSAKIELLEELAYYFTCKEKEIFSFRELRNTIEKYLRGKNVPIDFIGVKATPFITELTEEDGIVQKLDGEGNRTRYIFLHRTFQEYLTASYLNRQQNSIELAKVHFWDYNWHETLTLFAGLLEDPIPLLKMLTNEKDDIFQTLLLLAGHCIAECKQQSDPLIEDIVKRICLFWRLYPDLDFIRSIVMILGQTNVRVVEAIHSLLCDENRYVREKFSKMLSEISDDEHVTEEIVEKIFEYLVEHSYRESCDLRESIKGVLEVLVRFHNDKYEAFHMLYTRFEESCEIRKRSVEALKKIGNKQAIEVLCQILGDEDEQISQKAAEALEELGNDLTVEVLRQTLNDEDEDVRYIAVGLLWRIGNERAVEVLCQALADENSWVRRRIAEALVKIGSKQAIEPLCHALCDGDVLVRREAAEALGEIGSEQAVEPLCHALLGDYENYGVRMEVVKALGKIGSERAVEVLCRATCDEFSFVRKRAVEALEKIGSKCGIERLYYALNSEDQVVRTGAARTLGRFGGKAGEQVMEVLCQAIHDEDRDVRAEAAEALGGFRNARVEETLVRALSDRDCEVRVRAVKALGKIGSRRTVGVLRHILRDKSSELKVEAAKALGNVDSENAIEILCQAIDDEEQNVRKEAITALGRIGSERAEEVLCRVFLNKDYDARAEAAKALGNVDSERAMKVLYHALGDEDCEVRKMAAQALNSKNKIYREILDDGPIIEDEFDHENGDVIEGIT